MVPRDCPKTGCFPIGRAEMSGRAGATVTETPGSHATYVSNATVVVGLIERAACEVRSPAMA